jgi:activating signal cointegrator complex subunit 1
MAAETSRITDEVVLRVNNLLDALTDAQSSEARNQGLRALVGSAVELSRMLVVQKAVFRVSMPEILPHQKVFFDASTMEDIGGEDEDGLTGREICCVTFPGIIKRGDETGGHLQYTNVISRARVLCSPE